MFETLFSNLDDYLQSGDSYHYETLEQSIYGMGDESIDIAYGFCKLIIETNLADNDLIKMRLRHFQLLLSKCRHYV